MGIKENLYVMLNVFARIIIASSFFKVDVVKINERAKKRSQNNGSGKPSESRRRE